MQEECGQAEPELSTSSSPDMDRRLPLRSADSIQTAHRPQPSQFAQPMQGGCDGVSGAGPLSQSELVRDSLAGIQQRSGQHRSSLDTSVRL